MNFPSNILSNIQQVLDCRVINIQPLSGGDINEAFQLQTEMGKYFVKLNTMKLQGMFEREYKGLSVLRNTNTIHVPQPIAHGTADQHQFLITEYLQRGTVKPASWQSFATQLASLHRCSSQVFGLNHDNYIGSLPQPNNIAGTWKEFYTNERILFQLQLAFDDRLCDRDDIQMAERLCHKLDDIFPIEPPALLHGDLWAGNYMFSENGNPLIFDPAVYYGHREMDLGMSLLFGGFDKTFYEFYDESFPLQPGWKSRTDVSQLYPLLVHLNLFGGHYYHSVHQILRKYQ